MAPTEGAPGRRRALLVATGRYDDPLLSRLRSPAGDVRALGEVLADPAIGGFDVAQLVDRTTPELLEEIEGFFGEVRAPDFLLLYISGHGILSEDRSLHFATSNTKLKRLYATAVEDAFVARLMRRSRARSVVLILDCCHSGAFGRGYAPKGPRSVDVARRFAADARGQVVLTASSELEYAFEEAEIDEFNAAPGSVFTRFIVEGLRTGAADLDQDGQVSADELYDYVHDRVRECSRPQTPGRSGGTYGKLIVARNPHPRRPSLPIELIQALNSPIYTVRVAALAELGELVRGDEPELAQAARKEAQRALQDPAERVRAAGRDILGGDEALAPPEPALPDQRELTRVWHDGEVHGVAFSHDAARLCTAGADRTARVWDVADGREQLRVRRSRMWSPSEMLAVAFSPDDTAIAGGGRDKTARVWDMHGRELMRITHGSWVRAVTFSPDAKHLATASEDRTARVWSVADGRELLSVTAGSAMNDVGFSPDGNVLATAGGDASAWLWDLTDDRQLLRVTHDDIVWAVAFSPDGSRLATASDDGTARVWDVSDGTELLRVTAGMALWTVAFGPAGDRLATGGDDRSARVWDLADGRELTRVTHDAVVWAVSYGSDGRLATASADHTARVWAV